MLNSILAFLLFLIPLIFFHELGHFLFAKLFGIQVDVFSIGLGPKLLSFRWRGTCWQLRLFPIGGMVKMLGESAERAQDIPKREHHKSYHHLGPGKKIWVAFGGPLFNIILALFILVPLFGFKLDHSGIELRRLPVVVNSQGEKFLLSPSKKAPVLKASLDDEELFQQIELYLHPMDELTTTKVRVVRAKGIIELIQQGF